MKTGSLVGAVFLIVSLAPFANVGGETIDEVLAEYRELRLREAPASAKLVKVGTGSRTQSSAGSVEQTNLGFQLKQSEGQATLLVGTLQYEVSDLKRHPIQEVDSNHIQLEDVSAEFRFFPFGINAAFITALQCRDRGWIALSDHLWERALKEDAGHPRSQFYQPSNSKPLETLARIAWATYANEIVDPKCEREATLASIDRLFERHPFLRRAESLALRSSLAITLIEQHPEPGTPATLIARLVDYQGNGSVFEFSCLSPQGEYRDLLLQGLDAVPSLIDHLDDERLTRGLTAGFNNFPTQHRRVREVVADVLIGLANDDFGRDWLGRQRGDGLSKTRAREWFERVRHLEERQYLLENALPPESNEPNSHIIWLIAQKYPADLPGLYRAAVERSEFDSNCLADLVAESSLPEEEKRALLRHAATHKNLEHRFSGLEKLRTLTPSEFSGLLVSTLNEVKLRNPERYWQVPDSQVARLVGTTSDETVWKTFEETARSVNVGLRIELLGGVSPVGDSETRLYLAVLRKFLTDLSVRIDPGEEDWIPESNEFQRLETRNFCAMEILHYLEDAAPIDPDTTDLEWEVIRKKADDVASKELVRLGDAVK